MKTRKYLYPRLYSLSNLIIAWKNAKKEKTLHEDVIEFEKDIRANLLSLHNELKNKTYKPKPLITFILRDPKTRKISKSDFRDRVVHHALINVIGKIFQKIFIYDSCANQINKGTLFALERFDEFRRKATKNNTVSAFCLKADVKHYFEEINHDVLISIIKEKIADEEVIWLIKQILANVSSQSGGQTTLGMPLGNLTSQFFANVYLNELDYFVKHELKAKYYIRYVDDFVILHQSKEQLEKWRKEIDYFLNEKLRIQLHPQKSRIILLYKGIDFVGFRNYTNYRLLRKRNIKSMRRKIYLFKKRYIDFSQLFNSYQGWQAYAQWANTHKLREEIKKEIIEIIWNRINFD